MLRRELRFSGSVTALVAAALINPAGPACAAQNRVSAAEPAGGSGAGGAAVLSAAGDSLQLLVGRSMFINTSSRLRRVYVSNPDVLNSFTSSPNQIVVTAKAPGMSGVILWDENGQSHSYFIDADVDVTELQRALQDALPGEHIAAQAHDDQIALEGTVSSPAAADQAIKLAALFSKNVTNSLVVSPYHAPQVRLKVRVVEIDRSRAEQLGFNFFTVGKNTATATTGQFPAVSVGPQVSPTQGSGGTNTTTTATSAAATTTTSSLLALSSLLSMFYYNSSLGLGAAIQDLENKQILQILAEPTITALNGETASFLSGGEFPFPVVQGASSGFTSVTIQFRPYGVKLDFTPNVLPDGTIQMKVTPEVSALDYTNQVTISGYSVPALSTRRAQTQVELHSGQSFMISGLLDNRTIDMMEKIPGIGDIPILGKLFQSKSTTRSVQELAVIVTPTLVDPLSENVPVQPPKMVVPFVNNQKFDKGMTPKKTSVQGAAQQ